VDDAADAVRAARSRLGTTAYEQAAAEGEELARSVTS
jgi:hypothetical protein